MKCVQRKNCKEIHKYDIKSGENIVNSLNIFFVFLEVLINCILEKQAELTKHTHTTYLLWKIQNDSIIYFRYSLTNTYEHFANLFHFNLITFLLFYLSQRSCHFT